MIQVLPIHPDDLCAALDAFSGSETFYCHWSRQLLYTAGVRYLAEQAGAFWLLDAIASYQPQLEQHDFQVWQLTVHDDRAATLLACADMDNNKPINVLVTQDIPYTDFPLSDIQLYLSDTVLLLPSEY